MTVINMRFVWTTYAARMGATAVLPADWTLSQQFRDPVLHCWAATVVAAARRAVKNTEANLENILDEVEDYRLLLRLTRNMLKTCWIGAIVDFPEESC